MDFLKKLLESQKPKPEVAETIVEASGWTEVNGVGMQVGKYLITASGYFNPNELIVTVFNTETKEAYKAEVFKNGDNFDVSVMENTDRRPKRIQDTELEQMLERMVTGFVQDHYGRIVNDEQDGGYSDEADSYYNRRERMRQGREERSEIEADY